MRTLTLLALLALAASPVRALAQDSTATVAGRVAGIGGTALAGAEVRLVGTPARAVTDSAGRFTLRGLPAGGRTLSARHVGYRSATRAVVLRAGERREVSLQLEPLPTPLDTVRSEAEAERGNLERSGFYRRRALGFGQFVTRDDIERYQAIDAWDVLRRIPMLDVGGPVLGRRTIAMRGGTCRPAVYLDGAPAGPLDALPASFIDGVEVYRNAAEVPVEYGGGRACGAILIWTR